MKTDNLDTTIMARCTALGYKFVFGGEEYANYESSLQAFEPNEKVLILWYKTSYTIKGAISKITYNGMLTLGQKKEVNTVSSLDETYKQKHDRRIKSLKTAVESLGVWLSCDGNLLVESFAAEPILNFLDENIDCVTVSFTLSD